MTKPQKNICEAEVDITWMSPEDRLRYGKLDKLITHALLGDDKVKASYLRAEKAQIERRYNMFDKVARPKHWTELDVPEIETEELSGKEGDMKKANESFTGCGSMGTSMAGTPSPVIPKKKLKKKKFSAPSIAEKLLHDNTFRASDLV